MTPSQCARSVGLGGRRLIDFEVFGLKALDVYRLAQIADRLDVSIDWLLGRSDTMDVRKGKRGTDAEPVAPRGSRRHLTF